MLPVVWWEEDQAANWGMGILSQLNYVLAVNLCFLESDFSSIEGGFGLDNFSSQF